MATMHERWAMDGDLGVKIVAGTADISLESSSQFVPVIRALYVKGYSRADFEHGGSLRTKTLEQLRAVLAEPMRQHA